MVADAWPWLLPCLFSAPWLLALVWLSLHGGLGSGDAPPSAAEAAEKRLWR